MLSNSCWPPQKSLAHQEQSTAHTQRSTTGIFTVEGNQPGASNYKQPHMRAHLITAFYSQTPQPGRSLLGCDGAARVHSRRQAMSTGQHELRRGLQHVHASRHQAHLMRGLAGPCSRQEGCGALQLSLLPLVLVQGAKSPRRRYSMHCSRRSRRQQRRVGRLRSSLARVGRRAVRCTGCRRTWRRHAGRARPRAGGAGGYALADELQQLELSVTSACGVAVAPHGLRRMQGWLRCGQRIWTAWRTACTAASCLPHRVQGQPAPPPTPLCAAHGWATAYHANLRWADRCVGEWWRLGGRGHLQCR